MMSPFLSALHSQVTYTSVDVFAVEGGEHLLLLGFVFKVNEAKALGKARDRSTLAGDNVGALDLATIENSLQAIAVTRVSDKRL